MKVHIGVNKDTGHIFCAGHAEGSDLLVLALNGTADEAYKQQMS
jgi:hypothetical protein